MLFDTNSAHFRTTKVWQDFVHANNLTHQQEDQFAHYLQLLIEWNELFNITAIIDPEKIIQDHFQDSLALSDAYALKKAHVLADIGSGGGLPGIPLKIKYPHLKVILVEVNKKKITFLHHVIAILQLNEVDVCDLDWRTFVRKDQGAIEIIVARASLRPDELVRMFKDYSYYQDSICVYWASKHWQLSSSESDYFDHQYEYTIADKQRKLIFFKNPYT